MAPALPGQRHATHLGGAVGTAGSRRVRPAGNRWTPGPVTIHTHVVTSLSPTVGDRFRAAVRAAACAELGHDLPSGTSVVGSPGRSGSKIAVAYPMGDQTVIWCAPEVAPLLASLEGRPPLSNEDFVEAGVALGGAPGGRGRFRVLEGMPSAHDITSSRVRSLDRDQVEARAVIAEFIAACPSEDRDEAELDIDDLDPVILAVLDDAGAAAALAYARPWDYDDGFDDIAIITRPSCRGQGLGAAAVAALARQQQARGRRMLYNCDVDNVGSNRLAESLGFTVVQSVASVRFS